MATSAPPTTPSQIDVLTEAIATMLCAIGQNRSREGLRRTQQVAAAAQEAIKPRGVAVMLGAAHFCIWQTD